MQDESSVQALIDACIQDDDKLYLCVSSPTIKDKPVQIRPWRLSDADFVLDASLPLDPRKTVFVGGVPRPLKAGMYMCILIPIDLVPNFTHRGRLVIRGHCYTLDQLSAPPEIEENSNKRTQMVVGPDYTHIWTPSIGQIWNLNFP